MKLRHRRVTNGNVGPILPLTTATTANGDINLFNSQTYTRRRRRRKSTPQSEMAMKSAACGLVACLMSLILIVSVVVTPFPESSIRSHAHQFLSKLTTTKRETRDWSIITCADGKTVGWLNDNYCDCWDDGRDEPDTAACSNILVAQLSFRCRDSGRMIHASRVHDGVYDCSDRSDEI